MVLSLYSEWTPHLCQNRNKKKKYDPTRGHTTAKRSSHCSLQKASKGEAQGNRATVLATWKTALALSRPLGWPAWTWIAQEPNLYTRKQVGKREATNQKTMDGSSCQIRHLYSLAIIRRWMIAKLHLRAVKMDELLRPRYSRYSRWARFGEQLAV